VLCLIRRNSRYDLFLSPHLRHNAQTDRHHPRIDAITNWHSSLDPSHTQPSPLRPPRHSIPPLSAFEDAHIHIYGFLPCLTTIHLRPMGSHVPGTRDSLFERNDFTEFGQVLLAHVARQIVGWCTPFPDAPHVFPTYHEWSLPSSA